MGNFIYTSFSWYPVCSSFEYLREKGRDRNQRICHQKLVDSVNETDMEMPEIVIRESNLLVAKGRVLSPTDFTWYPAWNRIFLHVIFHRQLNK